MSCIFKLLSCIFFVVIESCVFLACVCMQVNEEKKQISLGMKESYFKTSQPNEKNKKNGTEDFGLESQQAVQELSSSELSSKEVDDISDDDNEDDSSVMSLPPMPQAPQANYSVSPLEIVLGPDELSGDTHLESKPTEDSVAMIEELDKPSKREKKKLKEIRWLLLFMSPFICFRRK